MCTKLFKKEKKLRLIKTDNLKGKTIRQLIFEICDLRSKQLKKFERINRKLEEKQKKFDFERIKQRLKEKNRKRLFEEIKQKLEGRQKRNREKEFKKIRRRLERNSSYFKELELEIKKRKQKLRGKSKCTFPVLCKYLEKYRKSQ